MRFGVVPVAVALLTVACPLNLSAIAALTLDPAPASAQTVGDRREWALRTPALFNHPL